ncbi:Histone-lysine N-methyltransferase ASHR2 [Vitis vinifera]|uniref:Histone-lysine N-methyltransferase ASHR2 n=1 Tax=Vitis vinifera TaxID=29760 RepID=A0A438GH82_VITVI|nr:Histone-lysine N-methyltransferase ASHR2 [Vitis vinifera]
MALPSSDSDAPTFLHSLLSSLSPPQGVAGFSVELTTALLAKDKLNAFGLMEPPALAPGGERSVRAYGIYPKASFFNHDCLPNACRFDMSILPPTIILTSPLDSFMIQKRLLEDYGFTCYCDRCRVEANWKDDDEQEEEQDDDGQVMDEDQDEQMIGSENEIEIGDGGGENDFPHAYFFLRYMCTRENCWGTLAPLPPSDSDASPSNLMECNVCGNSKKADEDFNSDEDRLSVDD